MRSALMHEPRFADRLTAAARRAQIHLRLGAEKRAKGFEPSTFSLGSGQPCAKVPVFIALQRVVAVGTSHSPSSSSTHASESVDWDGDLASLASLWPRIPEVMRRVIMAMAGAAATPSHATANEDVDVEPRTPRVLQPFEPMHRAVLSAPHQLIQGEIS